MSNTAMSPTATCGKSVTSTMVLVMPMRPMVGTEGMLIFSARGLPHWQEPFRRLHLDDPALSRVLERGYAAADFGWGKQGMELLLRASD